MEKTLVICTAKGSLLKGVASKEVVIYYVDFAVKKEKAPQQQKIYGSIHFESAEPFHYKVKTEYSFYISGLLTIVPAGSQLIN